MISKEIIERVRAETDIVGLIGEYLHLKRAGRNFVALCPFHKEKTPSFNVSPDRQAYHCFGCGAGGNAITFIMNYENMSFPEAVKHLAGRLGIKIEFDADDDPNKPIFKALQMCAEIYFNNLWSEKGLAAQRYLVARGFNKETVRDSELGLVPQDSSILLSKARELKLSTQVLKDAGVLGSSSGRLYPFLSGRIVFPLKTSSGKLVGFSGRVWGDDANPAKYVNTPETAVFKKRKLLYGLHKARPYLRREGAIVVEGQMDVLKLVQEGIHNVVAPLGTAFTGEHATLLSRYADKVNLVFDGDDAGRKAAQRAIAEVLSVDLETRLLLLPEGLDPDSYLQTYSLQEFKKLLNDADEPVIFIYKMLEPKTVSDRKKTAEIMLSLIVRVSDTIRRELYLDEAANLLKIDRRVLADRIKPNAGRFGEKKVRPDREKNVNREQEVRLLKMMIQSADYVRIAAEHLPSSFFPEGQMREFLEKLYSLAAGKEQFTPGEILDLLTSEMQRKVSEWSFSQVEYSRDEFARALAHYLYSKKRAQLRAQLKDAESAGDIALARKILGKLNTLVKESNKIYQEL